MAGARGAADNEVFGGGRQWHELANLSGAILGDTELLGEAAVEQRALELLHRDSQRLRRLVDQLKAAWEITTGSAQVRRQPTELAPLVEAAAARAGDVSKGDIDLSHIELDTDRARLAFAIAELISNALDHGGGAFRIRAEATDAGVALRVEDHGPGFGPGDEGRVSQAWFKGEGSPGAGLGLWLACAQIELLGGSLELASRPGEGVRATLHIPR